MDGFDEGERRLEAWLGPIPFARHLGVRVTEITPGGVIFELPWRGEVLNSRRHVHGGAIATMIDMALGSALRAAIPDASGLTTISMTVNYLEPGTGTLFAHGLPVRTGWTVAASEARVTDGQGRLVATGSGIFRVFRKAGRKSETSRENEYAGT